MSQITLYLDDDTQAVLTQAAQAHGVSKSRWVAEAIRKQAAQEWPADCLALAGQFGDFPLTTPTDATVADAKRLDF